MPTDELFSAFASVLKPATIATSAAQ